LKNANFTLEKKKKKKKLKNFATTNRREFYFAANVRRGDPKYVSTRNRTHYSEFRSDVAFKSYKRVVFSEIADFAQGQQKVIFHITSKVTISGGYHGPLYIIGGGTVQYSTHQQRTFAPINLLAGFGLMSRAMG
jgi:hypothetical protein